VIQVRSQDATPRVEGEARPEIAAAAEAGLTRTPKTLPPWLFYDELGSRLFEAITDLPEYYLTRAEREIFETQAADLLGVAGVVEDTSIIELGAGSAAKTQILLAEIARAYGRASYVPVDVSPTALEHARSRLAREEPRVRVEPWTLTHERALSRLAQRPGHKVVLFIGSSIGNYEPRDAKRLLQDVRRQLGPEDSFVLGTDLVKAPQTLIAAYDDRAGVTAAFNRNVLVRLNRELGAHFVVERFRHRAVWNEAQSRIEMHLESDGDQVVAIDALRRVISFRHRERIHTESSYKYDLAQVDALFASADMARTRTFYDRLERFAVHVARPT
jgi:L-histidine Nalpha-methyltransferase